MPVVEATPRSADTELVRSRRCLSPLTLTFALGAVAVTVGCGGAFSSGPGTTKTGGPSSAIRALRVLVSDDVAIVVDGEVGPNLDKNIKGAVEAELGHAGLKVVAGRDQAHDLVVKIETRVYGAVYFVHGHIGLSAESAGVMVALAGSGEELHRDTDFASTMARKAVAALLTSGAIADFADKKNPRLAVAVREKPLAPPVERKPAPDPVVAAKARSKQGTNYYNLNRFKDALAEYEAAYLAVPDSALLYNIAQCHNKLGNRKEALGFYKTYLRNAPDAPNRTQVNKRIADLEAGK